MAKNSRVTMKDGGVSVRVGKSGSITVKAGGRPRSRDLPKGEKNVSVTGSIRFGGGKRKR
jgi:hypothetical protein